MQLALTNAPDALFFPPYNCMLGFGVNCNQTPADVFSAAATLVPPAAMYVLRYR